MAASKCPFSPTSLCTLDRTKDSAIACWQAMPSSPLHSCASVSPLCTLRSLFPFSIALDSKVSSWGQNPKLRNPLRLNHSAFIPLIIFFLPGIKSMFILSCKIWALQSQVDGQPFPEADRSASDCVIKINAQLKCLCAIKLRAFLTRHLHRSTVWSFHF